MYSGYKPKAEIHDIFWTCYCTPYYDKYLLMVDNNILLFSGLLI